MRGKGEMLKDESGEMYLETILLLSREMSAIRLMDIAKKMQVSNPAACRAVRQLKERGLVVYEEQAFALTEKGRALAESVYEKHCFLTDLLISIGVNPQIAEEDACKMEHCISDATFDALRKFFS